MPYKRISDYGLIGNSLSAALVSNEGSIDWCCLPRFDSASVFAALLDDRKGGKFQIKPRVPFKSHQQYFRETNVLQTVFWTENGIAGVTDFMPCFEVSARRLAQPPEVHRIVHCLQGKVPMEIRFEPRLDYARGNTVIRPRKHGVTARHEIGVVALSADVPLHVRAGRAVGRFTLEQLENAEFVLSNGTSSPRSARSHSSRAKLERTLEYWQRKASGCVVSGPWRDAIVRSYLALHLMIYSPTGAIVAAPTTSLPEEIGGERNWDYRYAWLRDASLTLNALFRLGHTDEATGFFNWLTALCAKCGPKAQILYDIDFEDPLDEVPLTHLRGYRDSRPVRVGNAAYQQLQLDVFGEVVLAAYNYLNLSGHLARRDWELIESFIDAACDTWELPDSGIWEMRGGPYHFVHSKLMCWVALDRGIKMAERLGHTKKLRGWREAARDIREDILAKGWNPEKRAFTQHYDTTALDASNLLMPIFGFLPVSDERMASTIERTVEELGHDGLLQRYRTDKTDDGLSGSEGSFLWCSFWLVRNLIRMGRVDEARARYERLLGYANHLGLLSEMVDPASGEALGNFPQALTHLAVVITGLELTKALGWGGGEPRAEARVAEFEDRSAPSPYAGVPG
jgi:GH15 family glucan-1,4-alpha-glucosidase